MTAPQDERPSAPGSTATLAAAAGDPGAAPEGGPTGGCLGPTLVVLAVIGLLLLFPVAMWLYGLHQYTVDEQAPVNVVGGEPSVYEEDEGGILMELDGGRAPDSESPAVDVYLDLADPASAALVAGVGDELRSVVMSGKARIILHPVAVDDDRNGGASTRTADALVAVSQDQELSTLDFAEALLAAQPAPGQDGLSDAAIGDIALQRDLGQYTVDLFTGDWYDHWVHDATKTAKHTATLAGADGFQVPTVMVDGVRWEGGADPDGLAAAIKKAAAKSRLTPSPTSNGW